MRPVRSQAIGRGRSRRLQLVALGTAMLCSTVACGGGYGNTAVPTTAPTGTLALGPMPPAPSTLAPTPLPAPTVAQTVLGNTVELSRPLKGPLATKAAGDRALLIGDGLLKSATPAHGGDLCAAMQAFGWDTSVAAKASAGTDYALTVIDKVFDPAARQDFDAVAIFLGTDLGAGTPSDEPVDVDAAIATIDAALTRLAPRPVLLVTVSVAGDHKAALRDFNTALEKRYETHPNIAVLDWATITKDDPSTVDLDGKTLTRSGVIQLGLRYANSFGKAPGFVEPSTTTTATTTTIATTTATTLTGTGFTTGTTPTGSSAASSTVLGSASTVNGTEVPCHDLDVG